LNNDVVLLAHTIE